MSDKKYWQSLEGLQNTPDFQEQVANEFQEELPVVDYMQDATKVESAGRRDFLKMMGFGISAAAVATSCKIPVKKAIPYAFNDGELYDIVPGIANYYATTFFNGATVENVLTKNREGRPIKIEANPNSPTSGTSAQAQASIIDLYDVTRVRAPKKGGDDITWEQADKEITEKLTAIAEAGGKIIVLSNSLASPITEQLIGDFKEKYPTAVHVMYDAASQSAIRKANQMSMGEAMIPSYNFDKAKTIVGFNCDFLGTWLMPVQNAAQYTKNRVPTKGHPTMSKHYQFQTNMTITGASADETFPIKPSEEKAALAALYNKVAGGGVSTNYSNTEAIDKVARDLRKGGGLVVSGTNDVEIQLLVNGINAAIGAYGNTINTLQPLNIKQGDDEALKALATGGKADAVILMGANPVYNTPYTTEFKEMIEGADLSVALSLRVDESASLAQYICPTTHYLESWNLLEPKAGLQSFVQPVIRPIFDARSAQDSLLAWTGSNQSFYDYIKANAGFGSSWNSAVERGFVEQDSVVGNSGPSPSASIAGISGASNASGLEVLFYESIAIGDGELANNPFLQELPDPITKVTWTNVVQIPYDMAEAEGINEWYNYKKAPTADVTVNGKTITLPVVVSFGQASNTVAIALGYGRTKAGRAADGSGQDAFPMVSEKDGIVSYAADSATISFNKAANFKLPMTQVYGTLQEDVSLPGRDPQYRSYIVKEATLDAYAKNEHAGNEDREKVLHHLQTLYGYHDYETHHWGMAIDLNACNGCGSCVISCNVENNIPVIGPHEVWMGREMHWMRIDRYYSGDKNNPNVAFQPMLCQHCDNAPCENVCPVNATNHSSEGINQMAYNRCIGTRYCANNCPYKVRRFNWLDYQGADYFGKWNDNRNGFGPDGETDYMFEDLTRLVLNPDVTVRSRGVIEKCSFCVQKVQEGKLIAKKEGRSLKDGEVKTACQTACPANAIVFGDINDENSEVHKYFFNNGRNYHVLEEQHFLPSIGYQTKIRNKEEVSKNFS